VETGTVRHLHHLPSSHPAQGPLLPSTGQVELVIARDPLLLLESADEAFLAPLPALSDAQLRNAPAP
jgi:hypothetical protein